VDGIAAVGIGAVEAAATIAVAGGESLRDVLQADAGTAFAIAQGRSLAVIL
jgi:hypothetical protein